MSHSVASGGGGFSQVTCEIRLYVFSCVSAIVDGIKLGGFDNTSRECILVRQNIVFADLGCTHCTLLHRAFELDEKTNKS